MSDPTLYVDGAFLPGLDPALRVHAYAGRGVVANEIAYVSQRDADAALEAERARWQALARPPPRLGYQLCPEPIADATLGDLACMRRAGHAGDHVALFGDAVAHDLAEALEKVEHLEREMSATRHDANIALAAAHRALTEVERERDAARAQVAELSALLGEAREAVDRGWRFPDGMPEDWRPLFVRELLAKLDTALVAAKGT